MIFVFEFLNFEFTGACTAEAREQDRTCARAPCCRGRPRRDQQTPPTPPGIDPRGVWGRADAQHPANPLKRSPNRHPCRVALRRPWTPPRLPSCTNLWSHARRPRSTRLRSVGPRGRAETVHGRYTSRRGFWLVSRAPDVQWSCGWVPHLTRVEGHPGSPPESGLDKNCASGRPTQIILCWVAIRCRSDQRGFLLLRQWAQTMRGVTGRGLLAGASRWGRREHPGGRNTDCSSFCMGKILR